MTKRDGGRREIVSVERERDFKKINKLLVKEKDCCAILLMSTSKPTSLHRKVESIFLSLALTEEL